jgi:hypothetical protein
MGTAVILGGSMKGVQYVDYLSDSFSRNTHLDGG